MKSTGKFLTLFFLGMSGLGCQSSDNDTAPTPQDGNATSLQNMTEEIEIGRNMAGKLLAAKGSVPKPQLLRYLNALAYVLKSSTPYVQRRFMVEVLNDPSVNAFACPGGYLFVTQGLLKSIQNEAQLAFVLSHEISHVGKQHIMSALRGKKLQSQKDPFLNADSLKSRQRLQPKQQSSLGNAISQQLSGGGAGAAVLQAVDGGLGLILKEGLDKSMEFEADQESIETIITAGYQPSAGIEFLKLLESLKGPSSESSLSKTHPSPTERIRLILPYLKTNDVPLGVGALGGERFKKLQTILNK
jgi:predicted Zn-dependent protease